MAFERKPKEYPDELHIKHWFDHNGLSYYEVVGKRYPHAVKYIKAKRGSHARKTASAKTGRNKGRLPKQ